MSYVSTRGPHVADKFMLAGHEVTQSMSIDVRRAKQAGRRVIFITAGESEVTRWKSDDDCLNCGGFGHFALEVIMAGPFKNAPPTKGGGDSGDEPVLLLRPAWHNGAWWSVIRTMYDCPVCSTNREIIL